MFAARYPATTCTTTADTIVTPHPKSAALEPTMRLWQPDLVLAEMVSRTKGVMPIARTLAAFPIEKTVVPRTGFAFVISAGLKWRRFGICRDWSR